MKIIPHWVEQRKKQSWLWGTFLNLIYCWLTWSFDYWFGYWERKNNTQNPQRRKKTFRETPFLPFFMLSLSHKLPLPWLVPAWAEVPQVPPPAAVLGGGRQFASVSPLVGTSCAGHRQVMDTSHTGPPSPPNPASCAWWSAYFILIFRQYCRSFTWCFIRIWVS